MVPAVHLMEVIFIQLPHPIYVLPGQPALFPALALGLGPVMELMGDLTLPALLINLQMAFVVQPITAIFTPLLPLTSAQPALQALFQALALGPGRVME